jgi:two-component system, response regulator PdtaR
MLIQDSISILIVEDELIVAESLALDLKRKGYAIAGIVSSGEAAIDAMNRVQPDIILMDIMIKGALDGIETSKAIRSHQPVPIIFITAFSDGATVARAKQTGEPLHYLVKPIRLKDLVKTIETALGRSDLLSAVNIASSEAQIAKEWSRAPSPSAASDKRQARYDEIDLSFFDMD